MSETTCRRVVWERSQGLCERCGQRGAEMHHRVNRSAGGKWSASNIVRLCTPCHGEITEDPIGAEPDGWHVPGWVDPASVPVLLHMYAAMMLLDDDGTLRFA